MSRIFIAWELGAGYGHIAETLPVALALRGMGHDVIYAVRELSRAEATLGRHGFRYFQAPVWLMPAQVPALRLNYAEVLLGCGYQSVEGLAGLVNGWLRLLEAASPDLVIADHAPTALLAARAAAVPRAVFGTGFTIPPARTPMPTTQPWIEADGARLQAAERRVLAVINDVLGKIGREGLASLAALFDAAPPILATLRELDHYGPRPDAVYHGPLNSAENGEPPAWPLGPGPKIFAYLSGAARSFRPVIAALAQLDLPTLVHARDLAVTEIPPLQSPLLRFAPYPVAIGPALARCALVVSHASHGLSAAALLAGRPSVTFPIHLEQAMLAHRLREQGLGLSASPSADASEIMTLLVQATQDRGIADTAREVGLRYAERTPSVARVAEICHALCRQGATS